MRIVCDLRDPSPVSDGFQLPARRPESQSPGSSSGWSGEPLLSPRDGGRVFCEAKSHLRARAPSPPWGVTGVIPVVAVISLAFRGRSGFLNSRCTMPVFFFLPNLFVSSQVHSLNSLFQQQMKFQAFSDLIFKKS